MHISIKSKETARSSPTLMIPPAPPCIENVDTGARGMSQKSLKMPRSSVLQRSCGVQGQPLGARKGAWRGGSVRLRVWGLGNIQAFRSLAIHRSSKS